ncbi:NACHT, LRR and PYD domains-containing protein 12-like [Halichoerus grypus]
MTDVYLFYFSKCLKTLTGMWVWKGQSCLWGLCSLAAGGPQNQQVLVQVSDLRRHGIGVYDISCTFLNHFLKKTEDVVNVYTFLHFSFQEFLAAVFCALKNDSNWMVFDQVGKTWQEIFQQYGKGFSSLTIQFLFGLLHKGKGKAVETTFGRKVSPGLRGELLKWTEKERKDKSSRLQMGPTDLFHYLYEIQEEEHDLASVLICNPNLAELDLSENPLGDTGVKYLCEGLRHSNGKVEKLELWTCRLTGECCQDLCSALYTSEYLRDLDLSDNALGDEGMQVLCEGLKHPSCKPQTLWLAECRLTDACRGALASVLNRNENLTSLDLSGNDLKDFGVQMLYDALIQPICKLQTF